MDKNNIFDGFLAINKEIVDFTTNRIQADIIAVQSLAACKDWSDAFEVQSDFATKATEEYSAEVSKLVTLTTDTFSNLTDQHP